MSPSARRLLSNLSVSAFLLGAVHDGHAQQPAAPRGSAAPLGASASSALPPGHPPLADAGAARAPEGKQLPTGHPSVDSEEGDGPPEPPADRSAPDRELPPGTVEVTLVDGQERPQPNVEVRLGILHQTIAEGDARENKVLRSDAQGKVRFAGLKSASDYSYRVSVPRGPATYASASFQLKQDAGQGVLLHLFPVTRELNSALVGVRSIVLIEPRDDVFQFQVMFRFFNIGKVTWVPSDLVLDLPAEAKGFTAEEGMSDTRFVAEGPGRVKLHGTFKPGQHDTQFRFQMTNHGDADVNFRVELPPHVADARVVAQAAPGMTLQVEGFDPAQPTVDGNGQRMLFTTRQMRQGDAQLQELGISLIGLPTHGPGRWIAVALAAGMAVAGIAAARRAPAQPKKRAREELAAARELLLDELVALERARRSKQIGPATYDAAKRRLVEALARLDPTAAGGQRPARKRSRIEAPAPSAG
ncbi:MAG TPA: hypothetical protein VK524_30660 [Polyangiaceae bacterium]|nr:hypothetical protein [Polyangiaceae bacterium]